MALAAFDATSDIGIAAFVCLLAEEGRQAPRLLDGLAIASGCHPELAIALLRAITEAAQIRLAYTSGRGTTCPMRLWPLRSNRRCPR
jgi:ribosomal protein S12 methylthiotransferase accessory factor